MERVTVNKGNGMTMARVTAAAGLMFGIALMATASWAQPAQPTAPGGAAPPAAAPATDPAAEAAPPVIGPDGLPVAPAVDPAAVPAPVPVPVPVPTVVFDTYPGAHVAVHTVPAGAGTVMN